MPEIKTGKSPRLSFKGYSFPVALYRNKDAVKYVGAAVAGYTSFISATGFNWKGFLIGIGVAGATLGGKLIADAIDFYFTEVDM